MLPMVEFAFNNSVHASTTHTPLFVNGLRHPRLPTHLECDTNSRGEGFARAKIVLALAHHVSMYFDDAKVADVDQIVIEADDLSNSDDNVADIISFDVDLINIGNVRVVDYFDT